MAPIAGWREFTTPPAVEALSTGSATGVQPSEATLTGTLTPGGVDTHYYFEWGTSSSFGSKSPEPAADAGSGTAPVAAQTQLSGLRPNTTYHYRLVGENSFGTTMVLPRPLPPRGHRESRAKQLPKSATKWRRSTRRSIRTSSKQYRFEYGETNSYGHEVPLGGASLPAGETPVGVSASLTGLKLGVTYHYRVVASNQAGTDLWEPDQKFTTVAPAPMTRST